MTRQRRAPNPQWKETISKLETSLMVVAEYTVILLATGYWLKLPPIGLTLTCFIPIVYIATRYGFTAAMCAVIASVVLSGFVFYSPRFTIYFDDAQQLIELALFTGIGLVSVSIIASHTMNSSSPGGMGAKKYRG